MFKNTCLLVFPLKALRINDVSIVMSLPRTQILVSKYIPLLKGSRAPWANSRFQGVGQKMYKVNHKHLVAKYNKSSKIDEDMSRNTGASLKNLPLANYGQS